MASYRDLLSSDLTILIGAALLKNPRLQQLLLVNLNLYDIDLQLLTHNAKNGNLEDLKKLSFKRSCFLDKVRDLENLIPALPSLSELNLSFTNLLAQLPAPAEFSVTIEKSTSIRILNLASISEDNEDAKKLKFILRAVKRNRGRIKRLNVSENYMSGACFHSLREALLKNRNIKSLKFYSQTSDKFFNDMFLEMTRFFEEIVRKAQFTSLKSLILSKGNKMRFKREL